MPSRVGDDIEFAVVMDVYVELKKIKSETARKHIIKYVLDRIRSEELGE